MTDTGPACLMLAHDEPPPARMHAAHRRHARHPPGRIISPLLTQRTTQT